VTAKRRVTSEQITKEQLKLVLESLATACTILLAAKSILDGLIEQAGSK